MSEVEKDVEAPVQGEKVEDEELNKDDEVAEQKDIVANVEAEMENKDKDEKKEVCLVSIIVLISVESVKCV